MPYDNPVSFKDVQEKEALKAELRDKQRLEWEQRYDIDNTISYYHPKNVYSYTKNMLNPKEAQSIDPFNPIKVKAYEYGERKHYLYLGTLSAFVGGSLIGMLSFFKLRKYRQWAMKQSVDDRVRMIAKQNILNNGNMDTNTTKTISELKSSKYIKSRVTDLPNSIDIRPTLPYSGDLKPNAWFEAGPLKLWNSKAYHPFATEFVAETVKWSFRLGLYVFITFSFEILINNWYMYPLGQSIYVRGISGFASGILIGCLASKFSLPLFRLLSIGIISGAGWMYATYLQPHTGSIAKQNETVMGPYIPAFDRAYKKKKGAELEMKKLAWKDAMERRESLKERMANDPEFDVNRLKRNEYLLLRRTDEQFEAELKAIGIDDDIKNLSKEELERKFLENKGKKIGINYEKWPWKYLKQTFPQWFILNKDNIKVINQNVNVYNNDIDSNDDEDGLEILG